jgi:hypothetical protein
MEYAMRRSRPLLLALTLVACGRPQESEERSEAITTDMAATESTPESAATRVPGIGVTAAPGVAFAYGYRFRLPPTAVARTQEAHAQACERLGIGRCRITGMRYRLVGENDIEAMLAFKLDPSIARVFGRNGIAAVEAAKGSLVEAEITGTDAGTAIGRLSTERAGLSDQLRRIDAELARPGRSASERAELQAQRADLQRQIDAAASSTADQRESLATTPMEFAYESGPAIRGFDSSAPLTSALDTAAGSAQVTLAVLLGALALLGPPALLLGAVWLGWRRFGSRRHLATSEPA